MSYLRLPPRTARQPLGRPGIRWNDPLARGLVLAAPDGRYDAASGRYATLDNAPTYGPHASLRGDVGIAQTFAASQKITFALPEGLVRPLSVACIAYLTDRNAAEEVATVKAGSNYYGILGRGDTAGNQAQAASSGGSFRARISIGSAYSARRVLVATFEPGPLNVGDPVYNIYVDGVAGTSYSVQSSPINDVATVLASGSYTGVVSGLFVWDRVIDADEVKALGIDNWQMFAPDVRRVYFVAPSAASGVTGTLASTLGNVTLASAGTLALSGSAAITLGNVTTTATGSVSIHGAAAITLGAVTSSATGSLALSGAAAISLGDVTAAATGSLTNRGALAATLGAVTLAAAGGSTNTGQVAVTLGDVTTVSAASLSINAQLGGTLGPVALAATGSIRIAGSLAQTLGNVTLASTGVLGSTVTGQAAITLGNVTLASTGTLALSGAVGATLGNVTLSATGRVSLAGSAAITLGNVTSAATGSVAIRGAMLATLGNVTLTAMGGLDVPTVDGPAGYGYPPVWQQIARPRSGNTRRLGSGNTRRLGSGNTRR